jgi:glutamine cyclotransferase
MVYDKNEPIQDINELEYAGGEILANIWTSDKVARIDPETGNVLSWFDFSFLRKNIKDQSEMDVFNGIAYNDLTGNFYFTGKYWSLYFEIIFKEK